MQHYTVVLLPDPETGAYGVIVPALPGCYSQGDTVEEALAMAREAISLHLRGIIDDHEPVPVEVEPPQLHSIDVEIDALAASGVE